MMELQSEKSTELIQRIKLLAGLNVIEKRKCQDGTFVYGNKAPFFLRVSTMTAIGEKMNGARSAVESVVLRILDTSRIPLALGELGFNSMQEGAMACFNFQMVFFLFVVRQEQENLQLLRLCWLKCVN